VSATAVVDGHTHLGFERFVVRPIPEEKRKKPGFRDRMELSAEALIARMDADGVARAVTFAFPLVEADRDASNDYVLSAARTYPDRLVPFLLIGEDIEACVRRGARGFKQHFLFEPDRFDASRVYPAIAEAGLPLIAHLRTRLIVEEAERILAIAPKLMLIIAHMGRCEPNTGLCVEENLLALRARENVFFETSTVRDPATFRRAVDVVGPERVIFGSDFPFNSYKDADPLAVELGAMRDSGLDAPTLAKVMGGNITALLGE
jgi:predicted TIM-barrel fold metal-dependent hydrolase